MQCLIIITFLCLFPMSALAQVHLKSPLRDSPYIENLRRDYEDQLNQQENEAYALRQEMEMQRQLDNMQLQRKLKQMQSEIDDLKPHSLDR